MIERLAFDGDANYNAIEASSHLARYSIARPFCAGRRVLDIACGQGYGSYFMKQHWGAAAVEGVDVASDAVEVARSMFAADGIRYHCHPAERIGELFEPESFDLIVCLETIEHVDNATTLLQTLKRHLRPGGVVIVSCPNDYWYYPTEQQGNPFHTRKFRFDDFRSLAEEVLGEAAMFLFGTPVSGFVNLPVDDPRLLPGGSGEGALAIQHSAHLSAVEMLPTDERVDDRNCSYFVGVWTEDPASVRGGSVMFPCSMNASAPASGHENVTHLQAEVVSARTELFEARANLAWMTGRARSLEDEVATVRKELEGQVSAHPPTQATATDGEASVDAHELRVLGLRAAGFQQENEFLKQELRTLRAELGQVQQEAALLREEFETQRAQAQLEHQSELQQALQEVQDQLSAARRETIEERRAREEQAAEVEDWRRRIENMDRVKRMIPGWAKGGLKRVLRWR